MYVAFYMTFIRVWVIPVTMPILLLMHDAKTFTSTQKTCFPQFIKYVLVLSLGTAYISVALLYDVVPLFK